MANFETSSNTTVNHYPTAQGPIKLEIITVVVGSGETLADPDTVTSLLANPLFTWIEDVSRDLTGTAAGPSAVRASTTMPAGKVINLHDLAVSRSYVVFVLGF